MHGWENLRDEDRDLILAGIEQGRALGGPFHVELDPIDVCNADCFFCNSAEIRNGAILSWERLGPLVDELIAGGLRSFRISGGGEPLLYRQLGQLMDKMATAGVVMDNVTTNGIRLTGQTLDHVVKVPISNVFISLNYATEEQYGRFMRISPQRFHTVVENIRKIDARLREQGRREKTIIRTQFFIHRSTLKDLDQIIDLSWSLPVDYVAIRSAGLLPEEEILTPEDIELLKKRMPEIAPRSRGRFWLEFLFAEQGIQDYCNEVMLPIHAEGKEPEQIQSPDSEALGVRPGSIEYCFIGWYSMLVQGTGDVHPCCFLLPNPHIQPFGNLNNNSVAEVWHGPMYRRHREEMRTVMLMQEKTPGQQRRFKCTLPFCWAHDQCVMAYSLADRPFYREAHDRLERLRHRPLLRAGRIANGISRRIIDRTKQVTGIR